MSDASMVKRHDSHAVSAVVPGHSLPHIRAAQSSRRAASEMPVVWFMKQPSAHAESPGAHASTQLTTAPQSGSP